MAAPEKRKRAPKISLSEEQKVALVDGVVENFALLYGNFDDSKGKIFSFFLLWVCLIRYLLHAFFSFLGNNDLKRTNPETTVTTMASLQKLCQRPTPTLPPHGMLSMRRWGKGARYIHTILIF